MAGYALYRHLDGHLTRKTSSIRDRRGLIRELEDAAPAGTVTAALIVLDDVALPLMLVS